MSCDLITTNTSRESRDHMLIRLSFKGPYHWHFNPRYEIDRVWIVHRGEIVGHLQFADIVYVPPGSTFKTPERTTRVVEQGGYWMQATGPIVLLEEPLACPGFRGMRYFDLESFERGVHPLCARRATA